MNGLSNLRFGRRFVLNSLQILAIVSASFFPPVIVAQVNSGSDGSDGTFNVNVVGTYVVDMSTRPDGIYQFVSVNISANTGVIFTPNASNTPVIWLVQGDCVINGAIDVSGQYGGSLNGGLGGPGGYRGGNRGRTSNPPTDGQGPGGGRSTQAKSHGGNASFGFLGGLYNETDQEPAGQIYGNTFLLPLIGGSGGGGVQTDFPDVLQPGGAGGGGGGAILIAANRIVINNRIAATGGSASGNWAGGAGSGGAVRLIANHIEGTGLIDTSGGVCYASSGFFYSRGGRGRVRFDPPRPQFSGMVNGASSRGFQPIIIPTAGQGAQLAIESVGGVPVSASPSGGIATPDAVLSAQQNNPISIAVHCSNIPLNTQITVNVRPAGGPSVSATGLNSAGTVASSTATILINMPRGGGLIYATAITAPTAP